MIEVGGRRAARAAWLLAVPLVLIACSGDDSGPTVQEGTGDAPVTASTAAGEMRPVPTVPPSTVEGETAVEGSVDAVPTIAPAPVDPDAPTTSVVAPTTDLVGDPQQSPATTAPAPPPPTTAVGDPDACARLEAYDVAGVIAGSAGVTATGVLVADKVCRYTAGSFVAEVHFVSIAEVRDDWYLRDGIEPVGEVGADAVGFGSFLAPGSPVGPGYTIALEGGERGVVVAVTGIGNARQVAGQVAIFAQQAA